jgi:UDP-N-acetylglucosamine 4,6-dehydratase
MTRYLITGGTGSLGKALIRKLLKQSLENEIIVFSRDEGKQALAFGNNPRILRVIGDVRDFQKLDVTMKRHKPHMVIHTAALKRIDDMEFHPDECVKTNIMGSENVARAALLHGVEKCILISTDKACQPVNVYGSSKFIAERCFTNYDYYSEGTIFASVRYGNVIASRGSFIPLWLSLLSDNQKIKVTSTDMSRFLFTLEDAVDTVLGALENAQGGEVFIPQICSYDMNTIIAAVERMHGAPVEYELIGLRPGEKLHEDMLAATELPFTYKIPGRNLLSVRPQYTNRPSRADWESYTGPEFNSALHMSNDVTELVQLIERGLADAN